MCTCSSMYPTWQMHSVFVFVFVLFFFLYLPWQMQITKHAYDMANALNEPIFFCIYHGKCKHFILYLPWLTQNAFTMANAHFIFVFAMVHANAFPMVNTKKKMCICHVGYIEKKLYLPWFTQCYLVRKPPRDCPLRAYARLRMHMPWQLLVF